MINMVVAAGFATDGIGAGLDQARKAAGDRDVAIAGGAATVNQYLAAGLAGADYDELVHAGLGAPHLAGPAEELAHVGRRAR